MPICIAGDSFYYLPTHELNAGCCVIAYRMQKDGKASERGPEPTATFTPGQWARVKGELKWDWDMLGTDRLKSILGTLPEKVPGTNDRPLAEEAKAAVANVTDEELDRIIFERRSPPGRMPRATMTKPPPASAQLARAVDELDLDDWRPLLFPAAKAPAEAYRFFLEPDRDALHAGPRLPALAAGIAAEGPRAGRADASPRRPARRAGRRGTYDPHAGQVRSAYDPAPESLLKIAEPPLRSDTARLYPLWLWARHDRRLDQAQVRLARDPPAGQ